MTILDAMHMLSGAWAKVSSQTIINCWKKAGFYNDIDVITAQQTSTVDEFQPNNLQMTRKEFENWVDIDNNIQVALELSDEHILDSIIEGEKQDNEEEEEDVDKPPEEEEEETPMKNSEIRQCLKKIRRSLEVKGFEDMASVSQLESKISDFIWNQPQIQKNIEDYVSPKNAVKYI
ncbi:hypothetical protein TCAL_15199 [Tigriopus californicus]|uniref:DDE-1 domain-containing protein n=2 Tax=Tigriopus californicus TaxID=6832 RepID=A0A553NED1_TIGCA|nr:hypothetical protein TCAL_15199 [Tigriopus californicus]